MWTTRESGFDFKKQTLRVLCDLRGETKILTAENAESAEIIDL